MDQCVQGHPVAHGAPYCPVCGSNVGGPAPPSATVRPLLQPSPPPPDRSDQRNSHALNAPAMAHGPGQQWGPGQVDPARNMYPCPNCGGYRTTSQLAIVNPRTGRDKKRRFDGCILWSLVIAGLVVGLFAGAVVLALGTTGKGTNQEETSTGALIAGVVVCLVVTVVPFTTVAVMINSRRRDMPHRRDFSCQICGYRWSWFTDQPYPLYTARSGLLEAGERALRQEEEAAHRRAVAARPPDPPPWWLGPGGPLGPPG